MSRRIPSPPDPGTSHADLHGIVAAGLTLTTEAVRRLDHEPAILDAEKLVGEALLLLRATREAAGRTAAWQDLYAAASPLARTSGLAVRLCRDPDRALELAFGHIHVTDLGAPSPDVDALLDLALTEEPCGPAPFVVAAIQARWLRDVRDGAPDPQAWQRLLEDSALRRPVDLLRCSLRDVYDLTHAVMHATDLGLWPPPPTRPQLTDDLDALLGIALDAGNLDLTTELLWSWPMLRLPWTPAAAHAWTRVSTTFDQHGFLPGPDLDPTLTPARDAVLRTSYHATLVLGLLAAAVLRTGDAPTRPDSDEGLAPMRLAVDLRRASDRADLPAVRGLLAHALEHGLTDGRAVQQAARLLRRTAALAGASRSPAAPSPRAPADPSALLAQTALLSRASTAP